MNYAPRRILITGAGSGIGQALALEAAARGMRVALSGRREGPLAETHAAMKGEGHLVIPCDVLDAHSRMHVVDSIESAWGALDILVNNAGVIGFGPLSTLSDEEVWTLIATNLFGPITMVRECVPLLRKGRAPQIANMGSLLGSIPYPLFAAYSATKSGLHGFSTALRRELRPLGIDVTHVTPRGTRTPSADQMNAYAEPLEMKFDAPERVAGQVLDGLARRKPTILPKGPERIFLALQTFAPGLIDRAIVKQMRRAAAQGLPTI